MTEPYEVLHMNVVEKILRLIAGAPLGGPIPHIVPDVVPPLNES